MNRARIFLSLPFAFAACAAFAQQPAPAVASAEAVAPMNCEKPGDSAGIELSNAQVVRFQKKLDAYKNCVNEYAKAMGAKANEHAGLAKNYAAAANGAIEDYNVYATALNAKNGGDAGEVRQGPPAVSKPKY